MTRPVEATGARTQGDYRHPTRDAKAETKLWLQSATPGDIEQWVDAEGRHGAKRDGNKVDGLASVLYVLRHFGSQTRDYSTGELEKLAMIVVRKLVIAERRIAELESQIDS